MRTRLWVVTLLLLGCDSRVSGVFIDAGPAEDAAVAPDASSSDAALPDAALPDAALPPTPDAARPIAADAARPDAVMPITPDAALPAMPDAALPAMPDAALPVTPDAAVPATPDAAVPATPDAALPDAAVPATPDAALPDAAPPDAALPDAALPDAAPPPIPYVPTCDLLVNGGAETGDIAGWIIDEGAFESRRAQAFAIPAPASGERLFFAGRAPRSRLRQDVALAAFGIQVDAEVLYASLTAQVRTWNGDDRASLELSALDADGQVLARSVSGAFAEDVWTQRQIGISVPRGTATLRAVLIGERLAGQDNDAYFDDVQLCLSDAPPPPPLADATVPPYLMWAVQDGVTVQWETEVAVQGFVDVDGRRFEEPQPRTHHEIRLSGLAPGTDYVYVAGQQDQAFAPATFRTAPAGAAPFDFLVWGDNQNGPEVFARLLDHMVAEGPDWAASVGDCVEWGLRDLYRSQLLRPIHALASFAPFLVAAGNHERLIDFGGSLFEEYMAQPGDEHCFGYRYGEAFFVFIDTELSVAEGSPQYQCIEAALTSDAARTATLRAALFHKPPRVEYWAGFCYTGESSVREDLTPLFARNGVNIVFNGHNHLYAYTPPGADGITWVTTGGGGGAIDGPNSFCRQWDEITDTQFVHHFLSVHVENGRMLVRAIDEAGEELHRFEVPEAAPGP